MIISGEFIIKVITTIVVLYALGHGLGVVLDRIDVPLWLEPVLAIMEWVLTLHEKLADFIAAEINKNEF